MKRATTMRAKQLRKALTDAERRLWQSLRYQQLARFKFRRQAPIGSYIVDFVCFERKVIVEVDGGGHLKKQVADGTRTRWLQTQGFRVFRFWNHEVLTQTDAVLTVIERACQQREMPPTPCLRRGSGRQAALPHEGGG